MGLKKLLSERFNLVKETKIDNYTIDENLVPDNAQNLFDKYSYEVTYENAVDDYITENMYIVTDEKDISLDHFSNHITEHFNDDFDLFKSTYEDYLVEDSEINKRTIINENKNNNIITVIKKDYVVGKKGQKNIVYVWGADGMLISKYPVNDKKANRLIKMNAVLESEHLEVLNEKISKYEGIYKNNNLITAEDIKILNEDEMEV
ncbi:MAG: hypothetical protein N4A47_03530 [Clostridia bacterium]|jgi:hypothetical protein|nr:hypothetical protein [Clostridia bacterium]